MLWMLAAAANAMPVGELVERCVDDLVKTQEAAEWLCMARSTFDAMQGCGRVRPASKKGKTHYWRLGDLAEAMRPRTPKPPTSAVFELASLALNLPEAERDRAGLLIRDALLGRPVNLRFLVDQQWPPGPGPFQAQGAACAWRRAIRKEQLGWWIFRGPNNQGGRGVLYVPLDRVLEWLHHHRRSHDLLR